MKSGPYIIIIIILLIDIFEITNQGEQKSYLPLFIFFLSLNFYLHISILTEANNCDWNFYPLVIDKSLIIIIVQLPSPQW